MNLSPKQEEILRDHRRFIGLIEDGKSDGEIAVAFNTDVRPVRAIAELLGYTLKRAFALSLKHQLRGEAVKLSRDETATRDARIVSLRDAGHSLEKIGQEFGITRERVRQILKLLGRDDLRDVGCRYRPVKVTKWTCRGCGKEHVTPASNGRRNYCSRECFQLKVRRESMWAQRVPEIIAARRSGKTWSEIGKAYGASAVMTQQTMRRYASEEEIRDIMGHDIPTRKYTRDLRRVASQ